MTSIISGQNNTQEVKKNLLENINRSFQLRIDGDYDRLKDFFHPLEWESYEKEDYPNQTHSQIINSLKNDHPRNTDVKIAMTFENIVGSILDGNNLTYIINYQLKMYRSTTDFRIFDQQMIMSSIDGGLTWKYFRISTSDCNSSKRYLSKYYSKHEMTQLNKNLCR
tara:strand:- start:352 stop:849 length:498 start_codon:yes stop_codon:yes gene_type:complete